VNGQDLAAVASHWLVTLPTGGPFNSGDAVGIVGRQATGAGAESLADPSSSRWCSAFTPSVAVSAGSAPSLRGATASSAGLFGLLKPGFSGAPNEERIAAFTGRLDMTKVAATIDDLFLEATGGQSRLLGSSALPVIISLAKSQPEARERGAVGTDNAADAATEPWTSTIDDELLATLAVRHP
jgi:hypothetical protein